MSFKETIKKQLRSVIEWENPDPALMFERWSDNGDEIKNSSKLIVGPGQGCIFVYEGRVEAVLEQEGITQLQTDNIPFWTTVKKFMQFFESEHKVGIYFFRKAQFLNLRWGTTSPVKYDDPKYKFPVGLGAFGNYSLKISRPADFFREVVASAHQYHIEQLHPVFGSRITQPLTQILAHGSYSYAEIDKYREELAAALKTASEPIFNALGIQLTDLRIEGTSFDEATQARINKIADAMAESQALQNLGVNFTQKEQLEALKIAAGNEGGLAGLGASIMAGAQLGSMMGNQVNQQQQNNESVKTAEDEVTARLEKLKSLFDKGLIDEAEYKTKKSDILGLL